MYTVAATAWARSTSRVAHNPDVAPEDAVMLTEAMMADIADAEFALPVATIAHGQSPPSCRHL